ncbi:GNAT family N-acetyltransferase [Ilumatobacter sp.]|uniref:GNAT family N-acetyltransferase n=1 Tax=Ilumatobacter sp. TaxID=1967498 RepID=UPI003B517145
MPDDDGEQRPDSPGGSEIGPVARRYLDAVRTSAEADLGHELPDGTTVVPAPDRQGSRSAVCYPLHRSTVVWCAPERAHLLEIVRSDRAATSERFTRTMLDAGATSPSRGHDRVLERADRPVGPTPSGARRLDPGRPGDRELVAALAARCPADDLDEAELDPDHLDPHIAGVEAPGGDGALAAVAYAQPWVHDPVLLDIGVICDPAHRRTGAAQRAVTALVLTHDDDHDWLYRCDAENTASDRLAVALGFRLVSEVTSVDVTTIAEQPGSDGSIADPSGR